MIPEPPIPQSIQRNEGRDRHQSRTAVLVCKEERVGGSEVYEQCGPW